MEKLRKRTETLEDQVVQKEGELRMAREDIERVQLKVKALMVPQNQSSREMDSLREQLRVEREANEGLRETVRQIESKRYQSKVEEVARPRQEVVFSARQ